MFAVAVEAVVGNFPVSPDNKKHTKKDKKKLVIFNIKFK